MANIKDLILPHQKVASLLRIAGHLGQETHTDVYVVGGIVRDIFLQQPLTEIDLMVIGDGIAFARTLADRLGVKKIVPFQQFGTAKIPLPEMEIEVASARTESYDPDSRKPTEVHTTDLEGDLVRRDFTINAMAVNLLPDQFGELYDPYSGIADLNARQLVTPMDPDDIFAEDPVRMMRAAYFVSKLGFRIERETYQSIKSQASRIGIVSAERITNELIKILNTKQPSRGFIILQKTGLMKEVLPEIDAMVGLDQPREWHHKDIFYHTLQVVDNAAQLTDKMKIRFAALVHDIAKPPTRRLDKKRGFTFHGHDEIGARMFEKIGRRMKLSNELREYLKKMIRLHLRPIALAKEEVTDTAIRRLMIDAGDDIDDLMILCRADITTKNPRLVHRYMGNFERVERRMEDVKERDALRSFQSPVRGDEIMATCGISEGRLVGKIKHAIEDAILEGEIDNSHEAAYSYLLKIKDSFLENQPRD